MLRLRRKDIRGSRLSVREQKSGKRKNIVFDRPTVAAVADHVRRNRLQGSDYLFFRYHHQHDVPMSRQWARAVIAKTAAYFGVDSIGAHSMRKIYACNLFRATGNLEAVQKALNHSKLDTTLIYLRDVLGTPVPVDVP
jgi:site-specific recombinase XerD